MRTTLATLLLLGLACGAWAGEWRQFRGTDGSSIAQCDLPTEWTEDKNVAWQAPLPGRGVSGPILVGNQVIVTSSSGVRDDRLHVLSFDAETGKKQWERQFWATGRSLHHPTSANAAPTPASDGQHIFAFFSSNDLICLDLEGNLLWLRGLTYDFPTAVNDVGMASSPIVVGDTVIVQLETPGDSFAAGVDIGTGATRWRQDRAKVMNWTSPVLWQGPGARELVLLQSSDKLTAHDPRSGEQVWAYDQACSVIPSATVAGGRIYLPSEGLTALDISAAGPVVAWKDNRLSPSNPSPIVRGDQVYVMKGAGVLACADAGSGKLLWQVRLGGTYWATPVLVGDYLYCASDDGTVHVVRLGDKGEVIAKNSMGEPVLGSPAVGDGAIYFRGDKHLWKIAKRP